MCVLGVVGGSGEEILQPVFTAFPECDILRQGQRLGWWRDKSVDTQDVGFVCVLFRSILHYRPILILATSLRS